MDRVGEDGSGQHDSPQASEVAEDEEITADSDLSADLSNRTTRQTQDNAVNLYWELHDAIHAADDDKLCSMSERIRCGLEVQADEDVNELVLLSAEHSDLTVLKFIVDRHGTSCLNAKYSDNDTVVHVAARRQITDCAADALQILTSTIGMQKCLAAEGNLRRTPVHCAAQNTQTPDVLLWLIDNVKDTEPFFMQDAENDTPLHLAFWKQNADTINHLTDKLGMQKCLAAEGNLRRTPVHYAALNTQTPDVLLWLIDNVKDTEPFFMQDVKNDTPLHLAFFKQNADTIKHLTDKLGMQKCLAAEGNFRRTPVHYTAANTQTPDVLLWLIDNVKDAKPFFTQDTDANTPILIAFRFQNADTIKQLTDRLGIERCLTGQGFLKRNAFHYAARNTQKPSVLLWLINCADVAHTNLFTPDEQNYVPFHFAFACQKPAIFSALVDKLRESSSPPPGSRMNNAFDLFRFFGASASLLDSWHSSPAYGLFLACFSKNFEMFSANFIDPKEQCASDAEGNTLLHALFLTDESLPLVNIDFSRFIGVIQAIIEAGVDPCQENELKQNCLFSAEISQVDLLQMLDCLSHSKLKNTFSKLQRNSEGLHVAHVFCGRYDIHVLEQTLCTLFNLSPAQLLAVRVSSGPMKDATCLHFACEAGHKVNVKYLLDKGGKLTDEAASGQTCVDFACNKGKLADLLEVAALAKLDLSKVLSLVDPIKRALHIPDKQDAINQLTLFTDPALKSSIEKDRSSQRTMEADRQQLSSRKYSRESPEAKMLLRALELDSSEMLRSLISLGFEIDAVDDEVDRYLKAQSKSNDSYTHMFGDLRKFESNDEVKILSVSECAVLFKKPQLLSDLMLLPQFDIIPETLRLLIHLRLTVQRMNSGQLKRVRDQALSVILNVLEHVFVNADSTKRNLLFHYLIGDFKDSNGVLGPKFSAPLKALTQADDAAIESDDDEDGKLKAKSAKQDDNFRRARISNSSDLNEAKASKPVSIMDLVQTLDCDELFATDCISELVDRQWRKPPPLPWDRKQAVQCSSCSAQPRKTLSGLLKVEQTFALYSVFFVAFLVFFAWYLTDFGRTLQSPAADTILLMYALSLTLQEVNDLINENSAKDVYVRQMRFRVPRYFTDMFNYFDMFGLLLMWLGLVLKLVGVVSDSSLLRSSQMVLSTSFLLLGFRSVALLSYLKFAGPNISMLKSLLFKDLAPFLVIMLVLVYSFGIFFFNLLFPAISGVRRAETSVVKVFTLPVSLAFGFLESAQLESCNSSSLANGPLGCVDQAGNEAYGILVFVYLLMVNIVMWNLLIALFNRTVTEMASKSEVLWRRNLFELLQEFAEVSPIPPPLSFLHYVWKLLKKCVGARCGVCASRCKVAPSEDAKEPWWQNRKTFAGYPEDFKRFLTFQAEQLRQHRPRLRRAVERHRNDVDTLKAHTDNEMAEVREQVTNQMKKLESNMESQSKKFESHSKKLESNMEALQLRQRKRMKRQAKDVGERLGNLEQQMAQILGLLQQHRPSTTYLRGEHVD